MNDPAARRLLMIAHAIEDARYVTPVLATLFALSWERHAKGYRLLADDRRPMPPEAPR
jgi:hypothetical protein